MAQSHLPPVTDEAVELLGDEFRTGASESTGGTFYNIRECPTGNDAVIGKYQDAGNHTQTADHAPAGRTALLFAQQLHRRDGISSTAASDQDFRHHDRHADNHDTYQVDKHEGAAAILPGDVRELPDISQAHGRSRDCQNERHPRGPVAVK